MWLINDDNPSSIGQTVFERRLSFHTQYVLPLHRKALHCRVCLAGIFVTVLAAMMQPQFELNKIRKYYP